MNTLPLLLSLGDDFGHFTVEAPIYWYSQTIPRRCRPYGIDLSQRRNCEQMMIANRSLIGKEGFQVSINVEHFKPSELQVKVVDNHILVEAKHEERSDEHGFISRHIVRRYAIPKDYDPNKVVSSLSSDGVLTISIPKPALEDKSGKERIIQIQQTGAAHLNVKENPKETEQDVKEQ